MRHSIAKKLIVATFELFETVDVNVTHPIYSPYIVTLFFAIVVAPFVAGSSRNSLLRLASRGYVLSTYLPWYAKVDRYILTSLACIYICVCVYVCADVSVRWRWIRHGDVQHVYMRIACRPRAYARVWVVHVYVYVQRA